MTGGTTANRLEGGAGNDLIDGKVGADTLLGGAGNDLIDGNVGADTLVGGAGNDTVMVDNAGDALTEAAGGGADLVRSTVTHTLAANVENLSLLGAAGIAATGNGLDNLLTGNAGANALNGGAGDDTLDGGAGADRLTGGIGDDLFKVERAGETVTEAFNQGSDTVSSSVSFVLANHVENLTLTGTTAASGTGNTLNNTIIGNAAANRLDGSTGNDTVTGGEGADIFIFNAAFGPGDAVTDMVAGEDTIQLSRALFNRLGPGAGLAATAFVIGAAARDANDRIVYNSLTGDLIYDENGNAAGGFRKFASLDTGLLLTSTDFLVA